jgi:tagatose-1,6-bisphosphate aldolase
MTKAKELIKIFSTPDLKADGLKDIKNMLYYYRDAEAIIETQK